LRGAYRSLFFGEGRFAQRSEAFLRQFEDDPLVGKIVAFMRAGGRRPLMHPRMEHNSDRHESEM
jgi:UDP-N-acetylglucosamine acyltransferase